MLGSKAFDPSNTELLCTACSRNSQKHSQFAHFSLKNGYLLMFLAGPKVKNSPASKLASNFWSFDPGIILYIFPHCLFHILAELLPGILMIHEILRARLSSHVIMTDHVFRT